MKKLIVLTESAKYDVSCASSGVSRGNSNGGIGSARRLGVCHSFADDGRCISLLKVLLTNHCRYDCAYCVNRVSNDVPRAAFTPGELAELTLEFYRRNFIEGLFLSSGIAGGPDQTMEAMVRAASLLRRKFRFNGYIHMKVIPGADRELVRLAGLFADRLSVNIEIPSEATLKRLAPGKDHQSVYSPMRYIREGMQESREERARYPSAPVFAPAGQSTQMIVGAGRERDRDILNLASFLYRGPQLKRVYYSGFIPVNAYDSRLPAITAPPLARENRLYQADWLIRLYRFQAEEIVNDIHPDLDLEVDPKLAWALRHPEYFPLDVNKADYEQILRIPGIGLKSARRIVEARRHATLTLDHLKTMGVVVKRAQYFITAPGAKSVTIQEAGPLHVRSALTGKAGARPKPGSVQLTLLAP